MPSPKLSFEIFPPASIKASFRLWDALATLRAYQPEFISVTYGAQGSTQGRTLDSALAVQEQTGLPVAAHLTAARASRAEIMERAGHFAREGISRIVALRGDGAQNAPFAPHPDGFADSRALTEALAQTGDFEIFVGAYPDSHPDAASPAQNIEWLKAKIDAGATGAITQFFFEAETFLRFRDAAAAAGITAPIIPGILPIYNWSRTRVMAERCGAPVPTWLARGFEKAERDGRSDLYALSVATELCSDLVSEGAEHLHLYTLNRADLTARIAQALGIEPRVEPLRNVA